MSRALVIAGHGSHLDANSSRPVHEHAARIRAQGTFDEVATVFWKEEPPFSRFLETVDSDDVTVVPVFMAAGYFTEDVIPREMALDGRVTRCAGRTIRYTRPVGAHERIFDVTNCRALEAGAGPEHLVAVIGHGTPRNATSSGTTVAAAAHLRATGLFRDAVAVFLDQEPAIATLSFFAGPVVAVPLFVADGWHAGVQVPGIAGEAVPEGLIYTPPVGLHESITGIILDLAAEAATWD
jgi:sirohydrochlorin cobaltochelatase